DVSWYGQRVGGGAVECLARGGYGGRGGAGGRGVDDQAARGEALLQGRAGGEVTGAGGGAVPVPAEGAAQRHQQVRADDAGRARIAGEGEADADLPGRAGERADDAGHGERVIRAALAATLDQQVVGGLRLGLRGVLGDLPDVDDQV